MCQYTKLYNSDLPLPGVGCLFPGGDPPLFVFGEVLLEEIFIQIHIQSQESIAVRCPQPTVRASVASHQISAPGGGPQVKKFEQVSCLCH